MSGYFNFVIYQMHVFLLRFCFYLKIEDCQRTQCNFNVILWITFEQLAEVADGLNYACLKN